MTLPEGERSCPARVAPLGKELVLLLDDRPAVSASGALLLEVLHTIAAEAREMLRDLETTIERAPAHRGLGQIQSELTGALLIVQTAAAQLGE